MKFIFDTTLILVVCNFVFECEAFLVIDGEISLAESPFAVCQCANSSANDPCRNSYKDWGIVNGTNVHSFNNEWIIEEDILGMRRLRFYLIGTKKFAILNLRTLRMNSIIFSYRKLVLFCSQSIREDVQYLNITKVDEIVFLPEAITERKGSLDIFFTHIEKDLHFPSNLYNYDYKITDYDEDLLNQTSLSDSFTIGPTINIYLYEVKNVFLSSHCISAKSTFFKIDGANSLVIERTAIRNSNPDILLSGLNLRKISRVNIENIWGVLFTVESCSVVHFYPNSLMKSVHSIFIAHVNNMDTTEETLLCSKPIFFVILNVNSWNVIERDGTVIPSNNSTEEEISLEEQQNTFIMNDTKVIFGNNEDKQLLKYRIKISNSTFERENFLNFSLSLIAHHFQLEDNEIFPAWIHLCQINNSIACQNQKEFRNVCEIGFPYQINKTIEEEISCQRIPSRYIPDYQGFFIQIFVGLGLLLLLILTIISILVIYRYRKLSGNWSPGKGLGNLTSIRPSTSFRQHQIIVLPSREPHYGFNTFPRHFSSRLSPHTSQAGFKCYFYYDNYREEAHEISQNAKNTSVKSIPNVQLLTVNAVYEDVPLEQSNSQLNNEI